MNKPVYEIPIGGGDDVSRPAGRRSAGNDFAAPQSSAAPSFPPPATSTPDFAPPSSNANFAPPSFAPPSATPDFPPPGLTPDFPPPSATPSFPPPGGLAAPSPNNVAVQPVVSPSDLSPSVGLGQAGSDPDLVAALNAVVTSKGSDLHVSVNAPPSIRVDGGLKAVPGLPAWDVNKVNTAILSIMSEAQKAHFAQELELDFAYTLSETSRFRVNVYLQRNVMGAAFRLIPTEIKQLAALGVPDRVAAFAQLARGLVLVTGPTGSGKSTTLAALIDLVNSTRSDHIVTVEDPIEFLHGNKKSLVNQREVGHDTHSFGNALKHVLRQDPDVILIGELRDLETISVALTAAETGHLVFATLHTQDAAQTIDRVIDVFPPHQQGQVRAQLAATLQGVVCQTLVKKSGGTGRAVATEVLITTPAVSNLIREGKTFQIHSVMQAGRDLGMHTMDQHLADLVNAGQISHQTAYEKAHDVEDLKQLIQRLGSSGGAAGASFGDDYTKGK
jgi:twitching motility protein PilT